MASTPRPSFFGITPVAVAGIAVVALCLYSERFASEAVALVGFTVFLGLVRSSLVTPIVEEWVKNHFYRKLGKHLGFVLACIFTLSEAAIYAVGSPFCPGETGVCFYPNWSVFVDRLMPPVHILFFFVSARFAFSWKGQGLATVLHVVNNLLSYLQIHYYGFNIWMPGISKSALPLLIVVNLIVTVVVAWKPMSVKYGVCHT